jgi:hypothetical protein
MLIERRDEKSIAHQERHSAYQSFRLALVFACWGVHRLQSEFRLLRFRAKFAGRLILAWQPLKSYRVGWPGPALAASPSAPGFLHVS